MEGPLIDGQTNGLMDQWNRHYYTDAIDATKNNYYQTDFAILHRH